MFGIFKRKDPSSFKTMGEFREFCESKYESFIKASYKVGPIKGTPMEPLIIMSSLNNCREFLESLITDITFRFGWNPDEVEKIVNESYRKVHDKYLSY